MGFVNQKEKKKVALFLSLFEYFFEKNILNDG